MIDNMTEPMEKETKRRFQLWLKPSVLDMADDLYEKDNCGSRSEFIEKAIQFYAGYLYAQQSQDYFPKVVTSTLKGILAESTNKISRILFKLAVEQAITMNVVAAAIQCFQEIGNHSGRQPLLKEVTRPKLFSQSLLFQHSDSP